MAKLTREDILKLAQLSQLKLTESEIDSFFREISEILNYVDMLKDVDVDSLEPTYQVTGLSNVTRPDEVKDYGLTQEDLMKNVPQKSKDYIKTKRIIG